MVLIGLINVVADKLQTWGIPQHRDSADSENDMQIRSIIFIHGISWGKRAQIRVLCKKR